jgi:hypothetical protein
MFICELCKREFKSPQSFSAHLTHPKSACKTNVKEYYDRYLKKPDEGICKHCGKETGFCSILKGYLNNICGRCKNIDEAIIEKQKLSRISTYREKQEKYEQEHKDEIEQEKSKLTVSCELCDSKFKKIGGLAKHIWQKHDYISIKSYYDKYLKKESEGICPVCFVETSFSTLENGYHKYHRECISKDKEFRTQIENICLEKYGVKNVTQVPEFITKSQETLFSKTGYRHALQVPEIKEKAVVGENNSNWNPNREEVFAPYTEKFSNLEFRNQIKKEQNYIDPVTEQVLIEGACLHHIDYNKQNDNRENLVWLNKPTHNKTNGNRDEWKQLLSISELVY